MFTVPIIDAKARQMGLPYLVIGGHAVNAYCEPRSTLDVDFLIRKSDLPQWRKLLEREGYRAAPDAETFAQFEPPYGVPWRVDLMLVNEQTFEKFMDGAREATMHGIRTRVPKPEHLIALKLHALKHAHPERFDKDFGDVLSLTRSTGLDPLSDSYRQLYEQFGTLELMKKSDNDSADFRPAELREVPPDYQFELPVQPGYRERPPRGSVDDGIALSLVALAQAADRPEIFVQREARRCRVEFQM